MKKMQKLPTEHIIQDNDIITPANEINHLQILQNFPGHTIACTDEDLQEAILARNLEPRERLEWLRDQRIRNLAPGPAGGTVPALEPTNPPNVVPQIELPVGLNNIAGGGGAVPTVEPIILPDVLPRLEIPVGLNPNAPGIIEPFLEQVLPGLIFHLGEDRNFLGQYLAEDVRTLLRNRDFQPDRPRYLYFLQILYNPAINHVDLEVGHNNRLNMYGFPYRIFALFSIFSPAVIAYLLNSICDGGCGLWPFIQALFRACRCLLLSGIPIRLLTLSTRRALLIGFRQGLRLIQHFINNIDLNRQIVIPLIPDYVDQLNRVHNEAAAEIVAQNIPVRLNFEERILNFQNMFNPQAAHTFERIREAHRNIMLNIRERVANQDRVFAERILANHAEIVGEMPRPLFDLLNNLHNWDYMRSYFFGFRRSFTLLMFSGTIIFYNRNYIIYICSSGFYFIRTTFFNHPRPLIMQEAVPITSSGIVSANPFFDWDLSFVDFTSMREVLLFLSNF